MFSIYKNNVLCFKMPVEENHFQNEFTKEWVTKSWKYLVKVG